MCGILGVFLTEPDCRIDSRMQNGLHALKHRGPDAQEVETYRIADHKLALGHTRLSVIDLSAGGLQPMHYEAGRYSIVFNGEIYNYRELRQELIGHGLRFQSDSDTEVLLAAWATWGEPCLKRLVGMFAFAVLDRKAATLTCVRDAFGIKPFFYAASDASFEFASEVPALLALRGTRPVLNWQRSYDYLVHGDYDSTTDTFFKGVQQLAPGNLLVVTLADKPTTEIRRWWKPSIDERPSMPYADAVDLVRERFLQSIRYHLRSDVPLGAALSGGVDSSAVVCAMRHVEPGLDIHTFSYVAHGSPDNEEHWVDVVNAHVNARAHKVVVSEAELARDIDDMIRVQGEPFGSTSIYAQYRVYKLAREHAITVTLDGQGADELLAGYSGYPGPRLRSLLETDGPLAAWRFLQAWSQWPGRSRMHGLKLLVAESTDGDLHHALRTLGGRRSVPTWLRASVLAEGGVTLRFPRQRPELDVRGRRLMAVLAYSLNRRGLASLLRHGDRNSMRFSIESRVPFLTLDQAELMLSMPEHYLISSSGETKSVFRAAMRGIVPDPILDRRDKIGFQTPEKAWLFAIADTVRAWLADDIGLPFLDQAAVVREFEAILAGRQPFSWQVWRWINFIRWHQQFFD